MDRLSNEKNELAEEISRLNSALSSMEEGDSLLRGRLSRTEEAREKLREEVRTVYLFSILYQEGSNWSVAYADGQSERREFPVGFLVASQQNFSGRGCRGEQIAKGQAAGFAGQP